MRLAGTKEREQQSKRGLLLLLLRDALRTCHSSDMRGLVIPWRAHRSRRSARQRCFGYGALCGVHVFVCVFFVSRTQRDSSRQMKAVCFFFLISFFFIRQPQFQVNKGLRYWKISRDGMINHNFCSGNEKTGTAMAETLSAFVFLLIFSSWPIREEFLLLCSAFHVPSVFFFFSSTTYPPSCCTVRSYP